jgi:hypothetical protein
MKLRSRLTLFFNVCLGKVVFLFTKLMCFLFSLFAQPRGKSASRLRAEEVPRTPPIKRSRIAAPGLRTTEKGKESGSDILEGLAKVLC